MNELTVTAAVENIEKVTEFVNEALERLHCPTKALMQIDIAIDELFGNIAKYAYGVNSGDVTVSVESSDDLRAVTITFADGGIAYDPLSAAEPDVTLCAEDRPIGGLGIYMVKKSMDEVSYRYENGKNVLSIKKYIGG